MNCQLTWIANPHHTTIYAMRCQAAGRPFVDDKLRAAIAPFAEQVDPAGSDWRSQQVGLDSSSLSRAESRALVAAAGAKIGEFRPQLAEELVLRHRPLRELWEAHGPGLLHLICHEQQLRLPEHAQILTVLPIQGGGGEVIAEFDSVIIESVLANPVAEIPEILRLAWLIAQLSPGIEPSELIPTCLAAGRELGIVQTDVERTARAAWLSDLP